MHCLENDVRSNWTSTLSIVSLASGEERRRGSELGVLNLMRDVNGAFFFLYLRKELRIYGVCFLDIKREEMLYLESDGR